MKNNNQKSLDFTNSEKSINSTNFVKYCIIATAGLIILFYFIWLICDGIFIDKGLLIDFDKYVVGEKWYFWDSKWYSICFYLAVVYTILLSIFDCFLMAYMVICGVQIKNNVKQNWKQYLYHLLPTLAVFVCNIVALYKVTYMMLVQQIVVDFDAGLVYHTSFIEWLTIPAALSLFIFVVLLNSFRKFVHGSIINDTNVLIITFSGCVVVLYLFVIGLIGFWDSPLPAEPKVWDVEKYKEYLNIAMSYAWPHIACLCLWSIIEVFGWALIVLLIIRIIFVIFIYGSKWAQTKSHIIVFSIITFISFGIFLFSGIITAGDGKADPTESLHNFIFKYLDIRDIIFLLISIETLICLSAGLYCLISQVRYIKKYGKPNFPQAKHRSLKIKK